MKNRKIDIFKFFGKNNWQYVGSTLQAKTCREAKAKYCQSFNEMELMVKANFSKKQS